MSRDLAQSRIQLLRSLDSQSKAGATGSEVSEKRRCPRGSPPRREIHQSLLYPASANSQQLFIFVATDPNTGSHVLNGAWLDTSDTPLGNRVRPAGFQLAAEKETESGITARKEPAYDFYT